MIKWFLIVCLFLVTPAPAQPAGNPSITDLLALADSLAAASDFNAAIKIELQALELAEDKYGPVDPTVAKILVYLGIEHLSIGDYEAAESYLLRGLEVRETVLGVDHPKTAGVLNNIGILYNNQGRYSEAEPVFERAIAIYDKYPDSNPQHVANCFNNLAVSYLYQAKYGPAKSYFERALVMRRQNLGPNHPAVAEVLNNLATVSFDKGDYVDAGQFYEQVLDIYENSPNPNLPKIAITLDNLGNVYASLDKYDEAIAAFQRAIDIKKSVYGENHLYVAISLDGLATVYTGRQQNEEARVLLETVLANFEQNLGPEHPRLATTLTNLGMVYNRLELFDQAEASYERALSIREKALGRDHPNVAATLTNLVILLWNQGRYAEAIEMNQRALSINESVLGDRHPIVAVNLENSVALYRHVGKPDTALVAAHSACTIRRNNLKDYGRILSERDALEYASRLHESFGKYFSCYLEIPTPGTAQTRNMTEAILENKGQVSDEIFERRREIVREDNDTVRALADSLEHNRKTLSRIYVRGPGEEIESYRASNDSLSRMISEQESELARLSVSFRNWQKSKIVSLDQFSLLIPDKTCVVEYLRYNHTRINPDGIVPAYAAVVISRGKTPLIVDLGEASAIDDLVGEYRDHLQQLSMLGAPASSDVDTYRNIVGALYNLVWAPVAGRVSGSELVFVCPDAALCLVSFAGLPRPDGGYLVEDHAIFYLSTGRDLFRFQQPAPPASGLLALGDPDYDLAEGESQNSRSPADTRGALPDCEQFWNTTVSPLPGTRREVEEIVSNWPGEQTEPVTVLLGEQADEQAFKLNAPGKRVIHLATHGYYLGASCRPANTEAGNTPGTRIQNPLLLSGLFLAGANNRGDRHSENESEDGVLTAFEVSALDLEGNQLVVLSACETGLGIPENGEGVYGLRRAFQLAGARTVVSALWEISDADAARFAGRIYTISDETLAMRFKHLQVEYINELRSQGRPDHPIAWAGFVAQGDWRK